MIYVTSNWLVLGQTGITVNQSKMNLNDLLDKLIEIEQSIGIEPDAAIREKVREAQDVVVQLKNRARGQQAGTANPQA